MLYSRFSLVIYFIHSLNYLYINLSLPVSPSPLNVHVFLLYVWIYLIRLSVSFSYIPHICINNMYIFLFLTSFTLYDNPQVHPHLDNWVEMFCSFLWLSNIPSYLSTTSSLSIPLWWTCRWLSCPSYCKSLLRSLFRFFKSSAQERNSRSPTIPLPDCWHLWSSLRSAFSPFCHWISCHCCWPRPTTALKHEIPSSHVVISRSGPTLPPPLSPCLDAHRMQTFCNSLRLLNLLLTPHPWVSLHDHWISLLLFRINVYSL